MNHGRLLIAPSILLASLRQQHGVLDLFRTRFLLRRLLLASTLSELTVAELPCRPEANALLLNLYIRGPLLCLGDHYLLPRACVNVWSVLKTHHMVASRVFGLPLALATS